MTTDDTPPSPFQRDEPIDAPAPDAAELARARPDKHRRGGRAGGGAGGGGTNPPGRLRQLVLAAGMLAVCLVMLLMLSGGDPDGDATLSSALKLIDEGTVTEAALNDDTRTLELTTVDGDTITTGYPATYGAELVERLGAADVDFEVATRSVDPLWARVLTAMLPLVFIGALIIWLVRSQMGGRLKGGDPKRTKAVETPEVTLGDVAGAHEAVEDLGDVVEFLRDPQRFSRLGAAPVRGVLLVGPPGTGKTLLARAVAGEAGVPFFSLSGSDFVEMFVGVGASRIRSAFDKARKEGPAIVFIDEIDSIGKSRGGGPATGANDERESTLNALLVEMDGFHESDVVVIAATNRPDTLDEALLRPGRFDRQVMVPVPDRRGRTELFELYLPRISLDPALDVAATADRLARRSPGMTGAQVKAVCNEAALLAAKGGDAAVGVEHLEQALERGALGRERRSAEVSARARKVTAWHEAGHTVCALALPDAGDPERVSIVPRGPAGGVTWFSAPDDEHFVTRDQCKASLVVAFGGRAAEELILGGDFTQGAASDIAQATDRAEKMVCEWGMSSLGMGRIATDRLLGDAQERVRVEVASLLDEAMAEARRILTEQRGLLDAIAEELLEHETLDRDDLDRIAHQVERAGTLDARAPAPVPR